MLQSTTKAAAAVVAVAFIFNLPAANGQQYDTNYKEMS